MKVKISVEYYGESIICAIIEMEERDFFDLRYDDEIEINFDDPKTEFLFCAWHKEPLTGSFAFHVFESSNSENNWHREKRKESEYMDWVLCVADDMGDPEKGD